MEYERYRVKEIREIQEIQKKFERIYRIATKKTDWRDRYVRVVWKCGIQLAKKK